MYGLQICAAAGLPSGTIHPILARLQGLGWLESRREDAVPQDEGRPRRRYYRLTENGAERARIALAQATTSVAALGLRPWPAGGVA
jgi:PadR family transcriptional regulator PadR